MIIIKKSYFMLGISCVIYAVFGVYLMKNINIIERTEFVLASLGAMMMGYYLAELVRRSEEEEYGKYVQKSKHRS